MKCKDCEHFQAIIRNEFNVSVECNKHNIKEDMYGLGVAREIERFACREEDAEEQE